MRAWEWQSLGLLCLAAGMVCGLVYRYKRGMEQMRGEVLAVRDAYNAHLDLHQVELEPGAEPAEK